VNDVALGGSQDAVARDVQTVIEVDPEVGMNISKCELTSRPGCVVTDPTLQSFLQLLVSDAELMGAPLFPGAVLDTAWSQRCDDLARAVDRLASVSSHDTLRACFSAPRVQHLMRCSPSAKNSALEKFDDHLRLAVTSITYSALSDAHWLHASMPIKHGGLGIRRVTSLAAPAFLASAASTLVLQEQILAQFSCPTDSFLDSYLSSWSSSAGPPPDPLPGKQSFWTVLCSKPTVHSLRILLWNRHRRRDSVSLAPHGGDWLLALLIANCGLRLDDEAVRVAVGMRLGLSLCVPHSCPCGEQQSLHATVCKKAPG